MPAWLYRSIKLISDRPETGSVKDTVGFPWRTNVIRDKAELQFLSFLELIQDRRLVLNLRFSDGGGLRMSELPNNSG